MSWLKMPGASGGATSPFIYLHNMVLKYAETIPSPDKEVLKSLIKIYVFWDMTLLFIGN